MASPSPKRDHWHIAKAQPQDARACCNVIRRSITETCARDYAHIPGFIAQWLSNKTPNLLRAWITATDGLFVVARAAATDAVIGVAQLSRRGEILLCYVDPQMLGRGLGHALCAHLESHAQTIRLAELSTTSTITAHALYLRQGFLPSGDCLCAGLHPIGQHMRKILLNP